MVAVVALATVAALWFGAANTLSAVMLAQLFGTAHYGSNLGCAVCGSMRCLVCVPC